MIAQWFVGLLRRSVGFVFVIYPLTWSTIRILSPKKARVPDELAPKPTDEKKQGNIDQLHAFNILKQPQNMYLTNLKPEVHLKNLSIPRPFYI